MQNPQLTGISRAEGWIFQHLPSLGGAHFLIIIQGDIDSTAPTSPFKLKLKSQEPREILSSFKKIPYTATLLLSIFAKNYKSNVAV